MKDLTQYIELARKAVERYIPVDRTPASLYLPIEYALEEGGKRIRPVLLLMGADAFGGDLEASQAAAAGIEVFHNFTLLHDDVMDDSPLRRGRPSVYAKWGLDAAILSGDTMLTYATQLITEVPDKALRDVIDTFNSMAIEVYEGQSLDMEFETRKDVSMEEYITMVEKKTGALLGGAVKIGALSAGCGKEEADALYRFGLKLGVAFQIQDDWLDVYGDEKTFGKPIGGDINNNKHTFLMISAREGAGRERFEKAFAMVPGPEKVAHITDLYTECGISTLCEEAIARYCKEACEALTAAGLDSERRAPFESLVEKLTGRRK